MPDSGAPTPTSTDDTAGPLRGAAPTGPLAARISLGLALISSGLMVTIGAVRLLRDGSFWLDEASIAINLLQQSPLELFGPYLTGHSFPRLYLLAISLLEHITGYGTMALRALPFLAFCAATIVWHRIVYLRLRDQPALLSLLLVLAFIPATFFAYGVMLKQYSLDVLLGLVPFLLSDSFFEQRLREGRGRSSLIALASLSLLSFTFVIPLLGRTIGWLASGFAFGRRDLDRKAVTTFAISIALGLLGLWLIDMRHTAGSDKLFAFWSRCIPASDWSRFPELLLGLADGWYRVTPFGARRALPEALILLLSGALALGIVESIRRGVRADATDSPRLAAWGSRSLGASVSLLGLVAAAILVQYPICPGRLTLFALFPIQLLTVEGFHAAGAWLPEIRIKRVIAIGLPLVIAGLCLPTSYLSGRFVMLRDTPENVRPLLDHIESEPSIPVVVAGCSTRQLSTLPEWLDDPRIEYYDERVAKGQSGYPDAREFWLISAGTGFYCPWLIRSLEAYSDEMTAYHTRANTAALYRVRMPAAPVPGRARVQ